jgi:hypothetical protein
MTESEEKAAFASAMVSTNMNPLEAGQLVHPANFNRAAQIASMWHNDAEVKALVIKIKKDDGFELASLPSKAEVARSLWERGHSSRTGTADYAKVMQLYAEIMGYLPKVSKIETNVKTNSTIQVIASPFDEKL